MLYVEVISKSCTNKWDCSHDITQSKWEIIYTNHILVDANLILFLNCYVYYVFSIADNIKDSVYQSGH